MKKVIKKVDLRNIFMNLQEQMVAKLSTNRKHILHPGTKGDTSELNWIEMLKVYLPERYKVDKAFVLDSDGNLSDQIDIVVYDRQYSPFLFNQDGALYIPSESVYAVFEVKQSISKSVIEYAGEKIKSVRRLKRTSIPIYHAGGKEKAKIPFEILAGILTLTSDWSPPLGNHLKNAIAALDDLQRINGGCVLKGGGFEVTYENKVSIEKSKTENALMFYFLRLMKQLQRRATVPAIDISQYEKVIT